MLVQKSNPQESSPDTKWLDLGQVPYSLGRKNLKQFSRSLWGLPSRSHTVCLLEGQISELRKSSYCQLTVAHNKLVRPLPPSTPLFSFHSRRQRRRVVWLGSREWADPSPRTGVNGLETEVISDITHLEEKTRSQGDRQWVGFGLGWVWGCTNHWWWGKEGGLGPESTGPGWKVHSIRLLFLRLQKTYFQLQEVWWVT